MKMKLLRGVLRGNENKQKRYRFERKPAFCYWCGCKLRYFTPRQKRKMNQNGGLPGDAATREHLQPASQGGTAGSRNLVAACNDCNQKRGSDTTWTALHRAAPRKAKGATDGR